MPKRFIRLFVPLWQCIPNSVGGVLEPVYQVAMHLELIDRGIANEREQEIQVYYKKHLLKKKYKMDLVAGDIIIELK